MELFTAVQPWIFHYILFKIQFITPKASNLLQRDISIEQIES